MSDLQPSVSPTELAEHIQARRAALVHLAATTPPRVQQGIEILLDSARFAVSENEVAAMQGVYDMLRANRRPGAMDTQEMALNHWRDWAEGHLDDVEQMIAELEADAASR